MYSLFIFTTDLRTYDNTTLYACKAPVIPIFVFNVDQVTKNPYKSEAAVQFMVESLVDLDKSIKNRLKYFYGKTLRIVEKIIKTFPIEGVYINKDYTPYAKKREHKLAAVCERAKINFTCLDDYKLSTVTDYLKFTPFYNKARKQHVRKPIKKHIKFANLRIPFELKKSEIHKFYKPQILPIKAGRTNGLKQLRDYNFSVYKKARNHPSLQTSMLSAHLKFNTLSIREVYQIKCSEFRRQLYWRDFYMQLYDNLAGKPRRSFAWTNSKLAFKRWKSGKTGAPIVDAAMHQLNKTHYMHGRCRMIVANYLTKVLKVHWKYGEKYFAQKLVDYDVANNNGGWQWASGVGADYMFRTFNPVRQQEKYDAKFEYINKFK